MKQSSDFRRIALDSLRGRWSAAVLAGFVTALLGSGGGAPLFGLNIDMSGPDISATFNGKSILSASGLFGAENSAAFLTAMPLISMAVIVFCIFYFIIGSCVNVGYARFNMNLVDGNNAAVENLFAHFGRWKTIALTKLL